MIITLLTDFGPGSEYVGAVHAILASACPNVARIDLAHDIAPGDVRAGAQALERLLPLAPVGVHFAVVDPGVGTARRAVAVELRDGRMLVGPDNGLLHPASGAAGVRRAVELTSPAHRRHPVSPTFHGRDVFAPATAHLAGGGALDDLGDEVPIHELAVLLPARVDVGPQRIGAEVAAVDRFGNVRLTAPADALDRAGFLPGRRVVIAVGTARDRGTVARTFGDVDGGELILFVDSQGMLALAANGADAHRRLAAPATGTAVQITAAPG